MIIASEKEKLGYVFVLFAQGSELRDAHYEVYGRKMSRVEEASYNAEYGRLLAILDHGVNFMKRFDLMMREKGPLTKDELLDTMTRKMRMDTCMRPVDFERLAKLVIAVEGWEAPKRIEQKNLNANMAVKGLLDELGPHMKQITDGSVI